MPDEPNHPEAKRTAAAGKKSAARKPTPSLLPILERKTESEREKFPFFIGAGIAVSIAVLVIVCLLSFCSHKSRPLTSPEPPAKTSVEKK